MERYGCSVVVVVKVVHVLNTCIVYSDERLLTGTINVLFIIILFTIYTNIYIGGNVYKMYSSLCEELTHNQRSLL